MASCACSASARRAPAFRWKRSIAASCTPPCAAPARLQISRSICCPSPEADRIGSSKEGALPAAAGFRPVDRRHCPRTSPGSRHSQSSRLRTLRSNGREPVAGVEWAVTTKFPNELLLIASTYRVCQPCFRSDCLTDSAHTKAPRHKGGTRDRRLICMRTSDCRFARSRETPRRRPTYLWRCCRVSGSAASAPPRLCV